jgi:hypothetical protein
MPLPLLPGVEGAVAGTAAAGAPPGTAAPQVVQNLAPGSRLAPQELQNAMASPRYRA